MSRDSNWNDRSHRGGGREQGNRYSNNSGSARRQNDRGANRYRPQKPIDQARLLAARTLIVIETEGKFANLVLPKMLREVQVADKNFSRQDSAFVSELVYGTTRRQGTLDWILSQHSSKPLSELDPPVLACLRLGTYQLAYMRVPDHAAVSETVSVARELAGDSPSKFVNAVLRSVLREGQESIDARIASIPNTNARLSIEHSHPEWVVSAYAQSLLMRNMQEEDLALALEANNKPAEVTLAARPSLISSKELGAEAEEILGTQTRQGSLSEYSVIIESGDPGVLPSIRSGAAGVQDEGSQLAATLLAGAPLSGDAKESESLWLDLCAGPGGKAALLASIGSDRGIHLVANEVGPHRARLLSRSVQALENVEVTVGDGRKFSGAGTFDRVLVDAPCLGLGSLRRRPESRWRHCPSDLDELLPLQRELLHSAIGLAKEGGVIAWVTCSPHVKETLSQVADALMLEPVELLDAGALAQDLIPGGLELPPRTEDANTVGSVDYIVARTVQLWPHIHGTDAMFIALFRKSSASESNK